MRGTERKSGRVIETEREKGERETVVEGGRGRTVHPFSCLFVHST